MKNKTKKNIVFTIITLNIFIIIWVMINRHNLSGSLISLKTLLISISSLSLALTIFDIFKIFFKQKSFKNILMTVKQSSTSKYLMLSFISIMAALLFLYLKHMFTIPLVLFSLAMAIFNFFRHKSKYYLSEIGIFWAGIILLWKDVASYEFIQKNITTKYIKVNFNTSSNNFKQTIQIPYNDQNEDELKNIFKKYS